MPKILNLHYRSLVLSYPPTRTDTPSRPFNSEIIDIIFSPPDNEIVAYKKSYFEFCLQK